VEPADAAALARHIQDSCKSLLFRGLMTIGMADYSSKPDNFKVRCPAPGPRRAWRVWQHGARQRLAGVIRPIQLRPSCPGYM